MNKIMSRIYDYVAFKDPYIKREYKKCKNNLSKTEKVRTLIYLNAYHRLLRLKSNAFDETKTPIIQREYEARYRERYKEEIKDIDEVEKAKWAEAIKTNPSFVGIRSNKRRIIISLTSHPGRIHSVQYTVKTLLLQTKKPDMVVLWLAEEQFPGGILPTELTSLEKHGLTIRWCDDIKSYKKLVPSLKEYEDAIIITVDDDCYYPENLVKNLYISHLLHPKDIIANRITRIDYAGGSFSWIPGGFDYHPGASFLNKLVGCGGVLYPIGSVHPDVIEKEIFTELAPTSDDLWFWFMAIRNETKVRNALFHSPQLHPVPGTQQGEQLCAINDSGERLFELHFANLLGAYPEVREKLLLESSRKAKK